VLIALALTISAAGADELAECRAARPTGGRIAACSKVIDDQRFSREEKALAYQLRGQARADAGAVKEAIADFSQALTLVPGTVAAYAGRGLARLTAGDVAGALSDYDEAVRLAPTQVQLLVTRGHIRLAAGDADGAIDDLSKAIGLAPENAVAFNNRGLAWRRKGQLTNAEADYTAALMINPIYALTYANRGYVREALGHKAEAVQDLKQALLLDPSLSEARAALKRLSGADETTAEADRRVRLGRQLAETNCSRCHAIGKLRQRHPQLALREPLTRGILAQHDEMPRFPLSSGEIDAIVAYISGL
jgi:tetratricopeptide (TPR) repeat protein